jgi:hypothetical protein
MELNSEIITIFSLIVSSILVGVVIFQYRLSLKQYETINRPWLIFEKTEQHIDFHYVIWSLKNIGNIPAEKIKIVSKKIMEKKNHDDIVKESLEPIMTDIIMPKQKFTFVLNDITVEDLEQCDVIEVQIFIEYQFLNHKKISEFRYYRHNGVEHEDISCIKAN